MYKCISLLNALKFYRLSASKLPIVEGSLDFLHLHLSSKKF